MIGIGNEFNQPQIETLKNCLQLFYNLEYVIGINNTNQNDLYC